jgi:hypothetical protein
MELHDLEVRLPETGERAPREEGKYRALQARVLHVFEQRL